MPRRQKKITRAAAHLSHSRALSIIESQLLPETIHYKRKRERGQRGKSSSLVLFVPVGSLLASFIIKTVSAARYLLCY